MALSEDMKSTVGRALGKIPSGLFILSTTHEGTDCAQLASWVQQAAFDPPVITAALARERQTLEFIRKSGLFAVSILAETDHALMKKYARGVEPGSDAFSGITVLRTLHGLPALGDALAVLECRLVQACRFDADHELLVGQVLSGHVLKEGKPFMHVRGSGFHY